MNVKMASITQVGGWAQRTGEGIFCLFWISKDRLEFFWTNGDPDLLPGTGKSFLTLDHCASNALGIDLYPVAMHV